MPHHRAVAILPTLLAILLCFTSDIAGQSTRPQAATVAAAAPVFLKPDPNREPLATLRAGTQVSVLDHEGEWYRVEFRDQFGTRTGYVKAEAVTLIAEHPAAPAVPAGPSTPPAPSSPAAAPPPPVSVVVPAPPAPAVAAAPTGRRDLAELAHQIRATPEDIESAIAQGMKARGRTEGLVLVDSEQQFSLLMDGQAKNGFSIELYTPLAWVRQLASDAAKEYRSFSTRDLTEEDLSPIVRVVVHPDTPNQVTAQGMRGTSSVRHVVLRDETKHIVIQPLSRDGFNVESANAMGGRAEFQGIRASFSLDEFREIRGSDGNAEFFVTVIGTSGTERDFKVKRKHFTHLP